MTNNKKKYAKLVLKIGLNVTKGDKIYITSPAENYKFTRELVDQAYNMGANEVLVDFKDDQVIRSRYVNEKLDNFMKITDFDVQKSSYLVENKFKFLAISASDPNALKDVDSDKITAFNKAYYKQCRDRIDYTMGDFGSWLVISVPTKAWAQTIFGEVDNAIDLLWNEILKACRCDLPDPIQAWNEHIAKLNNISDKFNQQQYDALHFTNDLGTDLVVKLPKNHIWAAANSINKTDGSTFVANMPTEEVFTMPHKDHVNGKVYATKPLVYNGSMIKDFWLEFKNGEVVDYDALVGFDVLSMMLNMDDGAKKLGEVALVEFQSPINLSNLLFYNTLYDENASCHLALGRAYPTNIQEGTSLTANQKKQLGVNESSIHVDFMFGSKDMQVVAYKAQKSTVIFKNGTFK